MVGAGISPASALQIWGLRVSITFAEIVTWLVVGFLGGAVAGALVKRTKQGFGFVFNLVLGCVGAVVGGLLFRAFSLFPGLDSIAISLRDLVSAVVGSLVVLALLWAWNRYGRRRD